MAGVNAGVIVSLLMTEEDDDDEFTDVFGTALMANIIQSGINISMFPTSKHCSIIQTRRPRTRIFGYVDQVVAHYSDSEFRRFFRLSISTFEIISDYLKDCPELCNGGSGGREPIPVSKQLLMTLWYFGGADSITKIADRFGVSESSVILSRSRIIDAVLSNLKQRFIKWPSGQTLQDTINNFSRRNGFPGIVGALDGTHIPIKGPTTSPQSYVNRKKFHSLQLQAVCNPYMVFTDCFAGYPGSCHDSRVLKNSPLWENGLQLCNGNHILADGGYPLRRWLLTPFRDNGNLTREQKNFNYQLSANRVVIERAFGLLKGRFYRLRYLDTKSVKCAVEIIMVACVLHNICLLHNDDIQEFMEDDDNVNRAIEQINLGLVENEAEGIVKRNALARQLSRH